MHRIEREHTIAPHLWPMSLGIRGRVSEGRAFAPDEDAEAAYAYVARSIYGDRSLPAR